MNWVGASSLTFVGAILADDSRCDPSNVLSVRSRFACRCDPGYAVGAIRPSAGRCDPASVVGAILLTFVGAIADAGRCGLACSNNGGVRSF